MANYCSNTLIVKGNKQERINFLLSDIRSPKKIDGSLYIRQMEEGQVILLFETRWSPNEEWFKSVCEQFPTLELELYHVEENEGIAGKMWNDNGKLKDIVAFRDQDRKTYSEIVYS